VSHDRYPSLGPVTHCTTWEKVARLVCESWPDAHAEASTGAEMTRQVGGGADAPLVAHCWNPGGDGVLWRVRIKKGDN
jgi:hypothetical protein